MAASRLDCGKAARALVDAQLLGDDLAAARHGITVRTIGRWRKRMESDQELSDAVRRKLEFIVREADDNWLKDVPEAIRVCLRRIKQIVEQCEPSENQLDQLMRIVNGLGELDLSARVLNVQFEARRAYQEACGTAGSVVTHPSAANGTFAN